MHNSVIIDDDYFNEIELYQMDINRFSIISFCLSNTLVGRDRSTYHIAIDTAGKLIDGKLLKPEDQGAFISTFIEYDTGKIRKNKPLMYAKLGGEFDIDEVILEDIIANCTIDNLKCYDGVIPFLTKLREKGKKLVLITNGRPYFQTAKISKLGLEEMFDVVVISEEIGHRKPDIEIFYAAYSQLIDVNDPKSMKSIVHIGGDYEQEGIGAENAGIGGFIYLGKEEGITKNLSIPSLHITSHKELFKLFK